MGGLGVSGVGPDQAVMPQARRVFHSSGRAAWRSWTDAAVITTSRTSPVVSTAICRLRPWTFLAASQPRLARGTVSAARTDWESMTAAVGWGLRPAAARPRRPGRSAGRCAAITCHWASVRSLG
jgi:hypothetical protein